MENLFTLTNPVWFGDATIIKRDIFDELPPKTSDSHGNVAANNTLVCQNGSVLGYSDNDRRTDLDYVYAASDEVLADRFGTLGVPFVKPGIVNDVYDLGDLPSPLQTRCEAAEQGHKR